jgi:RNA polymerase sigma-70 factor (ECF subfamily)
MDDQQIFEKLQEGDREALGWVFKKYREPFLSWMLKEYGCSKDKAGDIFINALVILENNAVEGKITALTSKLETYVFSIGKNLWREQTRDNHKMIFELDDYLFKNEPSENPWETEDREAILKKVMDTMIEMGDPCRQLLDLFYLQNKSLKEIMEIMNYKNTDTVKTARLKCVQRLQKLLFTR